MATSEPLLRTRQVSQALGVSVSTIKRWVDSGLLEATRTVGKHRLIRLTDALKFARAQGLPHASLERMLGPGTAPREVVDDQVVERLTTALRQGRAREARALIHSVYDSSRSAVALADQLIRPVMERVGHGWMVGAWDIFQEHEATHLVASALIDLIDRAAFLQQGPDPLALGATPQGCPYILPGLLGELVLRELGWNVRNLGVNLPLRSLAHAVLEYRPRLVFLSVSHLRDERQFRREYVRFSEVAASCAAAVIVGGQALRPELLAELVYSSAGDRMAHLAEFARRLNPIARSSADGAQEPSVPDQH